MFVWSLAGDCSEIVDLRSIFGRIMHESRPEPVGSPLEV